MTLVYHAYAAPFSDLHSVRHPQKSAKIQSVRHEFGRYITTKKARLDGKTVKVATLTKIGIY